MMTQLFNAFLQSLKKIASPIFNQIIFYGAGFLLIFIYLLRRDKAAKENALNQAKVKSYELQREKNEIDRNNGNIIDNDANLADHTNIYNRLRQDGQTRD